jgi:hypothetical protein
MSAQTIAWYDDTTRPVRGASKRAQELWRKQLQEQETEGIEVEENDEEWLTKRYRRAAAADTRKDVTRRALAWLRTDEPRRPLGRWAKDKVWSDMAEMYV